MTQPSRGAAAFLTLFGLPFLGAGLAFIYKQLAGNGNHTTFETVASILFGSVFVFIGGGLIYAALRGYGLMTQQAAREEANPLSPWLWQTDWASRRAESQNKKSAVTLWVLAVLCNVVTLPFLLGMIQEFQRNRNPGEFLLLVINLLGAVLVIKAARATIRHRRFGDTYFEFDALPFSTGERVRGKIHLQLDTRAEHGIDVRLTCVRKVVSGSGDHSATNQVILWQADQNVPSGAVGPGPLGRAIPVDFSIPADGAITSHDNPSDQVLWLLHAQADVPGVDYSDDFEIPVFRGAASAETVRDSGPYGFSGRNPFGFATARSDDSDEVAQPAHTKVVVGMGSGGTEFYFPALRNPGRALVLFLVMLLWTGVAYMLYQKHAPIFFFIVFGLSDLLIIAGFLHVTFGSSRITVRSGEILSRKGILGIGRTRRIQVSDVASIVPVVSAQQATSSASQLYAIRMRLKDGSKLTLADEIDSRQEARWVVSQIETFAGLKLDTHVEVDLPLGVTQQLPGQTPGQVFTPSGQSASVAASMGVFFVMAAGMFGFMAWRMSSFTSRAKNSRTAAAAPVKPVARRVFSAPLTDADVERIHTLPAQAQAEELLERAIGHDTRALELFDRQVESWTGQIRMTDRMKQLERRSEFSKDLRVRYANVDLNLALEGWQKNEQAANSLIERARTDPPHRAWAIYYLGMLAGRAVDYERIHGVLANYARYDQNAGVRQWAVEGMRFLGKDEVLDELFTSFTEDPANSVRDRAGCNISDCGIFTRKQRMRMVPKLIDLAMNPRTTGQIRSWTFLALQEITDENLPADALAWSRWYQEHGSEKIAEFERLDWWQIRGDE
ncbi:MAG TPA: HEAT repeat domain-containing protein [Candidatus Acidoferrales bacterium]|nr:HEAT repeat domain-containing protein [Candidatus Acidoferrales bacterium]